MMTSMPPFPRANGRSEAPEEEGDSTRITSLGNLETALRARRQELSAYVVVPRRVEPRGDAQDRRARERHRAGGERAASPQRRGHLAAPLPHHHHRRPRHRRGPRQRQRHLVNDEIIQHHELKEGDKIRLGANTLLKFTYQDKLDETFQQQDVRRRPEGRPDQVLQQEVLPRPARHRVRVRAAAQDDALARHVRHRSLQEHQRHLRAPRG